MDPEPQLNLLLELEDDAARARRRESVLLSVVTHLAALVVLLVSPMLSESVKGTLGIADEKPQPREQLTYLALPPDEQVVQTRPKTNALSDKDRQAQPDLETPLKLPPLPRLAPPAEPTPLRKRRVAKSCWPRLSSHAGCPRATRGSSSRPHLSRASLLRPGCGWRI